MLTTSRPRPAVTTSGYRLGMKPANAGKKYPAEILTRDEIHRLMANLGRGYAGARNRALVAVMWRCGLRVAEAVSLYPKDVDLDAGTVTVLNGKGSKRRVVGIDPEAGAVVAAWLERRRQLGVNGRHSLCCVISRPAVGGPMSTSAVREALKEAGGRAGIDRRIHPHGLRHTYASDLAREGVPLHIIQRLLGHNDLTTTARYIHELTPWEAIDIAKARTWAPTHPAPSNGRLPGAQPDATA